MKSFGNLNIYLLVYLLFVGCIRENISSGQTLETELYLFDSASNEILAYQDLNALYSASTVPSPSRVLTNANFSRVTNLAWAGMALDSQLGQLYLVSESGTVIRINRIREQTGVIANSDLTTFTLDPNQRLQNSKICQVSLDSSNHALYIAENGDSFCRLWIITNANSRLQNETISMNVLQITNETGGRSVVANNGTIFTYADNGSSIFIGTDPVTGPRLRKGSSSGFQNANQLIGALTQLGTYGSLALDTANNVLYVGLHLVDGNKNQPQQPILAFDTGSFGLGFNQPPKFTLGDPASQRQIRVLSHGGNKAWLLALSSASSAGNNAISIWMDPHPGSIHKTVIIPGSPSRIFKGLALDGNAN
ncbi:MAG: hypothetical protein ACKN9J_01485 [Holophagaceae bacterium]